MLIYVIDDEPIILRGAERVIREAAPEEEILCFSDGEAALAALEDGRNPDIVFSDIEMPGMTGLELAVKLRTRAPDARLVFVTGYSQYALEAFRVRAQGYLLKPLMPEQVKAELEYLPKPAAPAPADKLRVRCFGGFQVFWRDKPVIFQRKQSKELLAYLVDQEGRACTAEEIAAALWEDETDMKTAKNRVRQIIHDLRSTLRELGLEDLLIRERRQLALRTDRLDCDYYRMLAGDVEAVNRFRGDYMPEYSWAELTAGRLTFRK